MEKFGIVVFAHTRHLHIVDVLDSLKKQGALKYAHLWIDGHQGSPTIKDKVALTHDAISKFEVKKVHRHNGQLGFRKMMLLALTDAVHRFERFVVLEDDCFPTKEAIQVFNDELDIIDKQDDVFSVYGHHFLTESEGEYCDRFQGWGWATTSNKMKPLLAQLVECYSLTEERYLAFVNRVITPEIIKKIDVTPPRNPSHTLTKFFAWDETLGLLAALDGKKHKKTSKRVIYNFGASEDGARFKNVDWYREPPFNMVAHSDVWNYF